MSTKVMTVDEIRAIAAGLPARYGAHADIAAARDRQQRLRVQVLERTTALLASRRQTAPVQ